MKRVADAPPPSIAFSVAAPPTIAIGTLTFENVPADASKSLESLATALQGRAYNSNTFWHPISEVRENMQAAGYLTATVELRSLPPTKNGERYVVSLVATVQPGPQFRIATITADGGPLLEGRDLSRYFSSKPGDIAKPNPFGRLAGSLRAVYWRAGYADVEFQGEPSLDTEKALAAYALKVIPGPQYHLRSVAIENLDPVLEAKFRKFIGLQPGDTYDATAIPTTERMVAAIPELMGYVFSFSPHEDKVAHLMDLTFHFSRD
jgi:outer membrane protein assembly factor BamA